MKISNWLAAITFGVACVGTSQGDDPPSRRDWRTVGTLNDVHESCGLVLLADGRPLVVGGHREQRKAGGRWVAAAELYDSPTESWVLTGSLLEPRQGIGELALLADGRVLLAGEHDTRTGAELFDPKSGKWTRTGSLLTGRGGHTTTRLPRGQVLVSGGIDWSLEDAKGAPILSSAEIFDSETHQWMSAAAMSSPRFLHRAVALNDGRVLVIGGTSTMPNQDGGLATAEIYDPDARVWMPIGAMRSRRANFAAAILSDGRVLVAGGGHWVEGKFTSLASAEIFDPKAGTWTDAEPMHRDRTQFTMTRLNDGRVLAAAGVERPSNRALTSAEVFDPSSGSWKECEAMSVKRWNHRAVLLPSGEALIVGGCDNAGQLATSEIFTPR